MDAGPEPNPLFGTEPEKSGARVADTARVAKIRFLAMLSHELRTPLAPVQLSLATLEKEKLLSKKGRESVNLIRRNIELESRLLGDLLDIGEIVHGKMDLSFSSLDIHECVREALRACNCELTGKELELTVQLEAKHHQVSGDRIRLQQVFSNLLQNAAKFTPVGCWVNVHSYNRTDNRIVVDDEITTGPKFVSLTDFIEQFDWKYSDLDIIDRLEIADLALENFWRYIGTSEVPIQESGYLSAVTVAKGIEYGLLSFSVQ